MPLANVIYLVWLYAIIDILHLIGIGNGLRALKYVCFEIPCM